MDNKKRMMFHLEEDYYYLTIKVLSVLKALECNRKELRDFRKIPFLIELIKNKKNMDIFLKSINESNLTIKDKETLINIYCNGRLNKPTIKRVLFFLESKEIITLIKDKKMSCINVKLNKSKDIDILFCEECFAEEIGRVNQVLNQFSRIRMLKYESFIERIFENSEVKKWEG